MLLLLKRSPALVLAEVASHVAGRTFVPVDPTWPLSKILDIAVDAEVGTIVTDTETSESFKQWTEVVKEVQNGLGFTPDLLEVDAETAAPNTFQEHDVDQVEQQPRPEICYIMYTSGSTGKPKGVEVTTVGLIAFLRAKGRKEVTNISTTDVGILKTTCTFDVSIGEIW